MLCQGRQLSRGRPARKKLVYAVTSEGIANQLKAKKYTAVLIPPYDYTRVEKIKVAVVAAQSGGLLKDGDTVLALAGPGNSSASRLCAVLPSRMKMVRPSRSFSRASSTVVHS